MVHGVDAAVRTHHDICPDPRSALYEGVFTNAGVIAQGDVQAIPGALVDIDVLSAFQNRVFGEPSPQYPGKAAVF